MKRAFFLTFCVSLAGVSIFAACGGGLALPTGAEAVPTDFGSCSVVDGYAAVAAGYCEGALTCPGAYYAICNGSAWSACACSGAWLKGGTYSKVDKPDFGPAPARDGGTADTAEGGDGSSGDGEAGYTIGPVGFDSGGGCLDEGGGVSPPPACYGTDETKCCGASTGSATCVGGHWMCGSAPPSGCNGTPCAADGGGG
jgi:hypothetical protein